eukprot:1034474-Alexandrium_andersonii.AAC.1
MSERVARQRCGTCGAHHEGHQDCVCAAAATRSFRERPWAGSRRSVTVVLYDEAGGEKSFCLAKRGVNPGFGFEAFP